MKYCYSVKGDSGSRLCLQCKNIFEIKAKKAGSDSEEELPEVCKYVKVSQLELASDEEALASWARMQTRAERHRAGFLSASDFKQWEQACGISWDENSLLASPSLQSLAHNGSMTGSIVCCRMEFSLSLRSCGSIPWTCGRPCKGTLVCGSCQSTSKVLTSVRCWILQE